MYCNGHAIVKIRCLLILCCLSVICVYCDIIVEAIMTKFSLKSTLMPLELDRNLTTTFEEKYRITR